MRYLGNALREVTAEQHLASIVSPKTNSLVSKVGPLFVKNNPKGPHPHEKPSKAIITNPLRKAVNRRKIEKKGVRHLRVRNQKLEWRRENSRASVLGKETGNFTLGMDSRP